MHFSYINNSGGVDVIDNSTNTVITTIPVASPRQAVTVNDRANTTRVYVSDSSVEQIVVIDPVTNTIITTIPTADSIQGLAVNPAGTLLYAIQGGADALLEIDTATNTILRTLPIGGGPGLAGIVVSIDNAFIYITDDSNNVVYEVDAVTLTITDTIPVGTTPEMIDITPDGLFLYTANLSSNDVSVISTASNTVIATVPVGAGPRGIVIASTVNGVYAYVTNGGDGTVSVIDTATNTVVGAPIAVGTSPRGIATQSDGAFVYVTNFGSSNVSVIDTATNTVVATVPVGASPNSLGYFIGFVVPLEDLIVTKSFTPGSINTGGTSTLTITVENPNASDVNNVSFNDVYPAGLINATPNNASADIGTPVAVDGGNSLSWSVATLPANTTATITVDVTSAIVGSYNNNTGPVTGDEASSAGASATLTVTAPVPPTPKKKGRRGGGVRAYVFVPVNELPSIGKWIIKCSTAASPGKQVCCYASNESGSIVGSVQCANYRQSDSHYIQAAIAETQARSSQAVIPPIPVDGMMYEYDGVHEGYYRFRAPYIPSNLRSIRGFGIA